MNRTILAFAFLVVIGVGCEDEHDTWVDDYTFVWQGDHVTVYGYERGEADACAGSFAALETHTRAVMDFFGSEASLHYDYRWMSDDFWQGRCGTSAGACTARGVPWTRSLPDMHEISHAVSYASPNDTCPSLLEEGLAEYFSGPRFKVHHPRGELAELLTATPLTGQFYHRAGHFAAFLVETYGVDAVVRLCTEIPFYHTAEDWDMAVANVLNTSVDELLQDYQDYPECEHAQYRARLWECGGEPDFIFSAETDELIVEASCADPRAMGLVEGTAVVTRRILFTEDTTVHVAMLPIATAIARNSFMSQECLPCSADPQVFRYVEAPTSYTYRAGVHELILYVDNSDGDTVTLRLVRA